jgi:type II secretory pathway pseudopilin PulG
MKLKTKRQARTNIRRGLRRAGFTLAEVLAALAFMAIVIPVAVRGLQIASRAGVLAQRKAIAARIGERLLNEIVVAKQWAQGTQSGVENAGPYQFHWALHNQPWNQISVVQTSTSTSLAGINTSIVSANNIHELSVDVTFSVQSQDYSVHLSTLVDTTQPVTATIMPQL